MNWVVALQHLHFNFHLYTPPLATGKSVNSLLPLSCSRFSRHKGRSIEVVGFCHDSTNERRSYRIEEKMYIVLLSWNSLPVFVRMPIPCTAYELECLKNMFRNECLYVNILGKMQMDKKDG